MPMASFHFTFSAHILLHFYCPLQYSFLLHGVSLKVISSFLLHRKLCGSEYPDTDTSNMGSASAFCMLMNAENAPALSEQVTASQPEHCSQGSPGWKEACPGHTVFNDQPAWSPGLRTWLNPSFCLGSTSEKVFARC